MALEFGRNEKMSIFVAVECLGYDDDRKHILKEILTTLLF